MPSLGLQVVQPSFDSVNISALVFCEFSGMPGFTAVIKKVLSISLKKYRFLRNICLMTETFKATHWRGVLYSLVIY